MASIVSDGLVAGQKVGPYRVLFRLGKGGMGEVWAASHDQEQFGFSKLVALKILLDKKKESNAAVMFFDEARAASALQHQSIVSTVDLGQDGDTFYLAMEMVRGPSLTALLQRLVINKRKMTPAMVAHIGTNIASALDYAQTRAHLDGQKLNLIHRDVSPHNVLLDLNGAVRLTDFGVARTAIQDHKSRVGTVRGKPSYMAPEQVVGGDIDRRTDLYALGIVLYESACLKRLFGRSNPVKSMDAVLKHTPRPLTDLVPDFPVEMWKVLEKALQKKPEDRFQSAAEMADALTEVARKLDKTTTAPLDLVDLINKNFEDDAFDIDTKIEKAFIAAGLDPNQPPPDPTIAQVTPEVSPLEAIGTQVVWPTAYAPDPLAPEAIEAARTQFRALTPSASSPGMHMYTPAVDITPHGSQSYVALPAQKRRSIALPAAALAIAALVALTVAVVVTRRSEAPTATPNVVAQEDPPPKPVLTPVATAKQKPVKTKPKTPPPPAATAPVRKAPPTRITKPTKRRVKEPPPPAAPAPEVKIGTVISAVKKLQRVDKEKGDHYFAKIVEGGGQNNPHLAEIYAEVRKALAAAKP